MIHRHPLTERKICSFSSFWCSRISASLFLLLVVANSSIEVSAMMMNYGNNNNNGIGIAGCREDYDDEQKQQTLFKPAGNGNTQDDGYFSTFCFERYQSPNAIQRALQKFTNFRSTVTSHGGYGNVSSTKLGGDWVLAQSQQIAANCTTTQVLQTYLSGRLQQEWNADKVINCTFTRKVRQQDDKNAISDPLPSSGRQHHGRWPRRSFLSKMHHHGSNKTKSKPSNYYYQQDLVLHPQRVLTSTTGIMRYSQSILIDKIVCDNTKDNDNDKYCILIRLMGSNSSTRKKPFESLQVYVNLEPYEANHVKIYAAGILKVNRKVVPNLLVFDASGIAGSMAGKGTLWLSGYFQQ